MNFSFELISTLKPTLSSGQVGVAGYYFFYIKKMYSFTLLYDLFNSDIKQYTFSGYWKISYIILIHKSNSKKLSI